MDSTPIEKCNPPPPKKKESVWVILYKHFFQTLKPNVHLSSGLASQFSRQQKLLHSIVQSPNIFRIQEKYFCFFSVPTSSPPLSPSFLLPPLPIAQISHFFSLMFCFSLHMYSYIPSALFLFFCYLYS
jgi:hypothetical protein